MYNPFVAPPGYRSSCGVSLSDSVGTKHRAVSASRSPLGWHAHQPERIATPVLPPGAKAHSSAQAQQSTLEPVSYWGFTSGPVVHGFHASTKVDLPSERIMCLFPRLRPPGSMLSGVGGRTLRWCVGVGRKDAAAIHTAPVWCKLLSYDGNTGLWFSSLDDVLLNTYNSTFQAHDRIHTTTGAHTARCSYFFRTFPAFGKANLVVKQNRNRLAACNFVSTVFWRKNV